MIGIITIKEVCYEFTGNKRRPEGLGGGIEF